MPGVCISVPATLQRGVCPFVSPAGRVCETGAVFCQRCTDGPTCGGLSLGLIGLRICTSVSFAICSFKRAPFWSCAVVFVHLLVGSVCARTGWHLALADEPRAVSCVSWQHLVPALRAHSVLCIVSRSRDARGPEERASQSAVPSGPGSLSRLAPSA